MMGTTDPLASPYYAYLDAPIVANRHGKHGNASWCLRELIENCLQLSHQRTRSLGGVEAELSIGTSGMMSKISRIGVPLHSWRNWLAIRSFSFLLIPWLISSRSYCSFWQASCNSVRLNTVFTSEPKLRISKLRVSASPRWRATERIFFDVRICGEFTVCYDLLSV
jgi:hypothetical protein